MAIRSPTSRPFGKPPSTVTHLIGVRLAVGAPPRRSSARTPCSIKHPASSAAPRPALGGGCHIYGCSSEGRRECVTLYSFRSASTGSTRATRRAGTAAATSATTTMPAKAHASMRGSVVLTW